MNNTNDSKIIALKEQIEKEKAELQAAPKFMPRTSCVYEVDGIKYNLHTMQECDLVYLLAKLSAVQNAALGHGLEEKCMISGFCIRDCVFDIMDKLTAIMQKERAAKLRSMEATLDKLLSDDKKTEIEIAKIAEMFGNKGV